MSNDDKKVLVLVFGVLAGLVMYGFFWMYLHQDKTEQNDGLPDAEEAVVIYEPVNKEEGSGFFDKIFKQENAAGKKGEVQEPAPLPQPAPAEGQKFMSEDTKRIKMKKTPYSYGENIKVYNKKLTPEEVAEAPVFREIPMEVNDEKMTLVLVEKDGCLYDASDGVRVFIPWDVDKMRKTHRVEWW